MDAMTQRLAMGSGYLPAKLTFSDSVVSTSGLITYTFSGRSLSTADSTRLIIVTVSVQNGANTARSINSVTVAGVSATQVVTAIQGSSRTAIWKASVPTGTTGDVVVTLSGGALGCAVGVYAAYNLTSSDAVDTQTDVSASGAVITPAVAYNRGFIVAVYATTDNNTTIATFFNVTKDYDLNMLAPSGRNAAGASQVFYETNGSVVITAAPNATGFNASLCAASFN